MQTRGQQALQSRRQRGYEVSGEINEAQVAQFFAGAGNVSKAQCAQVAERILNAIERGEYIFGRQVSFVTMAAVADRLLEMAGQQ